MTRIAMRKVAQGDEHADGSKKMKDRSRRLAGGRGDGGR
jgi:hypothetical protein